mgnify:FL=1
MTSSPSNSSNPWKFATFLLVGLVVGYGLSQLPASDAETAILNSQQAIRAQQGQDSSAPVFVSEASADDDAVLGDPNAPITMIEFSDYQCPYCQRFYSTILPEIKKNYIDTGKVKFVYRDFPISSHLNALPAALSAECAGEQNNYCGMHDNIFDNFASWVSLPDVAPVFKQYAKEIGLDTVAFNSCLDKKELQDEVNGDLQDAIKYGVTATPTFFVNGQKVVGAQPFTVFQGIFDKILSEEQGS